jgi:hypothetical protein
MKCVASTTFPSSKLKMNPEVILSEFKKGEKDTKITENLLTVVGADFMSLNKTLNSEIQEDFEKYLEMTKSEKPEEIVQALDWMDSHAILNQIIDFLPLDFLPALLSFYTAEYGESAYDLLVEAIHSERYAEVLVGNGLIDALMEMFPKNNSIIVCAFLCDHQQGRRAIIESGFLPVINDFFKEDLLIDYVEQIAFFISHVTKAAFTFDESIPIINEILIKFMPHVVSCELWLLPSFTRAFDNALNSNSAFIDFFMENNLIDPFLVCNGSLTNFEGRYDANSPKYHEEDIAKYLVETTTDVLDMFNAIVADNDDYTDQLIVHGIINYLDDVFFYANDRVRIGHIILLSSLLESRPELVETFTVTSDPGEENTGLNFHSMVADLADCNEAPARLVAESTMLLARMIIAAENNPFVLMKLFEEKAFERISQNCEMLAQAEEQLAAVKAITSVTKLPKSPEIEHYLCELADNAEFNEWLEYIMRNNETTRETESYVSFLREILCDYRDHSE